jgi:hypothetical protein
MKVMNCTPHPIDIWDAEGTRILRTIPRSGTISRLRETNDRIGTADGDIPLCTVHYGEAYNLPERREDTLLIVSVLVKSALPERDDLVVPVDLVRDEEGHIVGCRALGK